jgi:hypothetical protein
MFNEAMEYPWTTIYPWTPSALIAYACPKLEEAFRKQGEETTRHAINQLFEVACQITGLSPDVLLAQLGFDSDSKDDDSIQSLFEVMHTITTLQNLGFTAITPLPPNSAHKEADLMAQRVTNLTQSRFFEPTSGRGDFLVTNARRTSLFDTKRRKEIYALADFSRSSNSPEATPCSAAPARRFGGRAGVL